MLLFRKRLRYETWLNERVDTFDFISTGFYRMGQKMVSREL